MKTAARYLDNDNITFNNLYALTLIKPSYVFVNDVVAYDTTKDVGYELI